MLLKWISPWKLNKNWKFILSQQNRYIKWSYSKYKVFLACKEQYFRKYVLYERPIKNNISTLDGDVLQGLFEQWVNYSFHKNRGKQWLLDSMANFFHYHYTLPDKPRQFKEGDNADKHLKALGKMVEHTYEFLNQLLREGYTLRSEIELTARIGQNVEAHGYMDFFAVKDGKARILVDVKAMTERSSFMDKLQLVFYNLLLYETKGYMPEKSCFFTAKDGKIIEHAVTLEEIIALRTDLNKAASYVRGQNLRILSDTNYPSPCYICDHKSACWLENGLSPKGDIITF